MRAAESGLTLGVAAARTGDIEEAIGMSTTALEADRKSLPSLLFELDAPLSLPMRGRNTQLSRSDHDHQARYSQARTPLLTVSKDHRLAGATLPLGGTSLFHWALSSVSRRQSYELTGIPSEVY